MQNSQNRIRGLRATSQSQIRLQEIYEHSKLFRRVRDLITYSGDSSVSLRINTFTTLGVRFTDINGVTAHKDPERVIIHVYFRLGDYRSIERIISSDPEYIINEVIEEQEIFLRKFMKHSKSQILDGYCKGTPTRIYFEEKMCKYRTDEGECIVLNQVCSGSCPAWKEGDQE